MRRKFSPYQRIVRAAARGIGVRLSADEVFDLGVMDDAIVTRALVEDDEYAEAKAATKALARASASRDEQ
jgi:hypothetical protein